MTKLQRAILLITALFIFLHLILSYNPSITKVIGLLAVGILLFFVFRSDRTQHNEHKIITQQKRKLYFLELFTGRINNLNFILASFLLPFLIYGSAFIASVIGQNNDFAPISNGFVIVCFIYLFLILLSVVIRRCHDIGKSGFFMLLNLIPVINLYSFYMLYFGNSKINDDKHGEPDKGMSIKKIFGF